MFEERTVQVCLAEARFWYGCYQENQSDTVMFQRFVDCLHEAILRDQQEVKDNVL
jgi:hypothetical protein